MVKADITMDAIESLGRAHQRSITNEAIEEALGLAQGAPAIAVVKSTDVMVGVE